MGKMLYALQTNEGLLQVTKGTYLSFIRRQERQKKTRAKVKCYDTQTSLTQSCCSIRTVRISKRTKSKAIIPKKPSQYFYNKIGTRTKSKHRMATRSSKISIHLNQYQSITLYTLNGKVEYPIYQDIDLFPQQIQSINIPMCFDNDCDTDNEQVSMAVDNLITSLSLAIYDNRYYKKLD